MSDATGKPAKWKAPYIKPQVERTARKRVAGKPYNLGSELNRYYGPS